MYNVRSLSLREKIIGKAAERGDDIGKTVWRRIISEPDLISAEAIYHHDCYVSFFLITSTSGQKRGRPKQETYLKLWIVFLI